MLNFVQDRTVKSPAACQAHPPKRFHEVFGLDVLVAVNRKVFDRWTFTDRNDQSISITSHLDVVKKLLRIKRPHRLLNSDVVDRIADIDWQIVENRALGNTLQAFDTHVTHDKIFGQGCDRQRQTGNGDYCRQPLPESNFLSLVLPEFHMPYFLKSSVSQLAKHSRNVIIKSETHQ